MREYDHAIIGGGITGSTIAYFLSKKSDSVVLIDRNSDVGMGASGAAGAFLSPLLGKPNPFKDLVAKALKYSTDFYKQNMAELITNCGVLRIPKSETDREKFKSYIPHMDFPFVPKKDGYFFPIGSIVQSVEICKELSKKCKKIFNYEVKHIEFKEKKWIINSEISANNLILATGADTTLIKEKYFKIRPVWGQRIEIETSSCITYNLHKECSVSIGKKIETDKQPSQDAKNSTKPKYTLSIGATHHRFNCDNSICNYCLKGNVIENALNSGYQKSHYNSDTKKLLEMGRDIVELNDVKILKTKVGARASSHDYFPMVGKIIDTQKTLDIYPYIKKGSKVPKEKFIRYENLFTLNGVGGRGFVLSPYLANILADQITEKKEIPDEIEVSRLFTRWARKNGSD